MDFKVLKWQIIRGSLVRRLLLRAFMFAIALFIVSFNQIARDVRTAEPFMLSFDECQLNVGSNRYLNFTGFLKPVSAFALPFFGAAALPMPCKESESLTIDVFKELMEKGLLDSGSKALCVGEGSATALMELRELGFSNAFGVYRHPFFSLYQKRFVYEINFKDDYFDFVFSRGLDRVSVPALLVLEIERVLQPGGIGVMLVGTPKFFSGSLIRSATMVSLFLKSSDVVRVCGIGSFTLVIFKKRFDTVTSFEHYWLPDECPSIANNKPLMKYIEPLVDEKSGQLGTKLSYLPNFMNISARNRLIYINVGAGEFANSVVAKLFNPYYPILHQDFNRFVIDHNTSMLSSYVKNPGITFVYHPGLAGDITAPSINSDEHLNAPQDEEGFDFIHWFKETIADGDFVILMMNARVVELNILLELFQTGAICHVDELFLRCSDSVDCKNAVCGDCLGLFTSLRNSGVFVHQWLED